MVYCIAYFYKILLDIIHEDILNCEKYYFNIVQLILKIS